MNSDTYRSNALALLNDLCDDPQYNIQPGIRSLLSDIRDAFQQATVTRDDGELREILAQEVERDEDLMSICRTAL